MTGAAAIGECKVPSEAATPLRRAIITGANGFVGSALTRHLGSRGIQVQAIVKDATHDGAIRDVPGVEIIHCDLRDLPSLQRNISGDIDVFYHLAWSGTDPSCRDDAAAQLPNVDYALKALQASRALGCRRFVTLGSPLEYDSPTDSIDERAPLRPQNLYAAAKSAIRLLGGRLAKSIGQDMNYVVSTSVYGANRKGDNVVSYTIRTLLRGERPVLSKLTQQWDFIHVNDLANALRLIAERGRANKFYAVGNGDNRVLKEVICHIRDIIGQDLPLGIGEYGLSVANPPSSIVDLAELTNDTGFRPAIPFSEGIREVIESFRQEGAGDAKRQ